MRYLIPKDELSLSEMRDNRVKAADALMNRAIKLGISGAKDELALRTLQPVLDLGCAIDTWQTAVLALVQTPYTVFQAVVAPIFVANRMAVFYGVSITTAPVTVGRLIFRMGGAAGNIIAEFDLETIVNSNTVEGYFSQPIPIDPQLVFSITAMSSVASGAVCGVVLRNFFIDPVGQTIA